MSHSLKASCGCPPDGRLLAYVEITPTTDYDIWVLPLSDPSAGSGQSRKAQLFLRTPFTETAPRFSPDGRWLASGVTPVGPPLNPRAFEARTGAKLWEFNTGDRSWLVSN